MFRKRTTKRADELTTEEFIEGGKSSSKDRKIQPQALAVLGIGAYRAALAAESKDRLQDEKIAALTFGFCLIQGAKTRITS